MNPFIRRESGFSIIELMIAMTIGLLLLSGLAMIFVSSSDANRELQKIAQQIENGRYAVETVSTDLRHAGFYGHIHDLSAIPAPASVPPDPCEDSDTAVLLSAMHFPVQGYRGAINPDAAADITGTSCGGLLTAANLRKGSDVLVIRRVDTNPLTATTTTVSNAFYVQASATTAELQLGGGNVLGACAAAPSALEHCKADGNTASTIKLSNLSSPRPSAPIRRMHVRVYFVAPCSVGSAGNGACTGAAGEDTIPTLKRLELTTSGNIAIVPLVEGIEYFKVEFGVDTSPVSVNIATGYKGDATVDNYQMAADVADWSTVIAAKLFVLARNAEPTVSYTDTKSYRLGASATDNFIVPAATGTNARYKRHVYTAAVQVVNTAGRREIP